jgi:hypothetical protein
MPDEACENCRFFLPVPKSVGGKCRRYPPVVKPDFDNFPEVAGDDWCGEWQAVGVCGAPMTNPAALVGRLDVKSISDRIDEIDRERESLRVLLRAARRNEARRGAKE